MKTVKVFENRQCGKIKPMHAVNNGPIYKFSADQRITNIDAFREAGIPYARNHDASYNPVYGGEHTVDVHFIFPNFDADEYDENSYDFACTDEYLKVIDYAGVKTFYRLGSKIEHAIKKYGTLPPKDFKKWAVICEHIIRHYTEGWANGFFYDIEYWEIWNEADLDPDDCTHKRTWGGTEAEYFELYDIAATHLKKCFPNLKIGGPALACNLEWAERFLKQLKAPLDFFSWHAYGCEIDTITDKVQTIRNLLDKYGYTSTESILNEWNYIKGWEDDKWLYSLKAIKGLKGASFTAGAMCASQYTPVDMLMYYDARPCCMNGLFCTDWVCENLKGYYPFKMFNALYKKGNAISLETSENIYAAAAKGDNSEVSVMLTYFDDNEKSKSCSVEIQLCDNDATRTAEIYVLDENNDMELVKTETINGKIVLEMSLFSTILVNVK